MIFFKENDNLLDDDDALDYILYEEINKKTGTPSGNSGCLASLGVLVSAVAGLCVAVIYVILY